MQPPSIVEENESCDFCSCGREEESIEAEKIKEELFENFQERIQIRRGLCELEAQNQLNQMEIKEGQEKLMRYTLSRSGKLIAKENCEPGEEFTNLPPNLKKQLSDIKKLQMSMNQNFSKKEIMQNELLAKAEKAKTIMNSISARIKHKDKKEFLEIVVKNYILQLENDELEYNLKLQEKLNIILVEEIKRLRSVCSKNGLMLSEKTEEDNEEDDFVAEMDTKNRNNMFSVSPQRKFNKKLNSNQSLYQKTKTYEKIENVDKVASEKKMVGSTTELTLPPIKEFNTPKNKIESRLRGNSRQSKEMKQEFSKVDQEVRNAINAITSLNNIGHESYMDRRTKIEQVKKQLKNPKILKQNPKLPPTRELSFKK